MRKGDREEPLAVPYRPVIWRLVTPHQPNFEFKQDTRNGDSEVRMGWVWMNTKCKSVVITTFSHEWDHDINMEFPENRKALQLQQRKERGAYSRSCN